MMCPVCGKDTAVKDSRPSDLNTIRRRRVCEAGHKTVTWESTYNPDRVLKNRETSKKRMARKWAAMTPEERLEDRRRREIRSQARKQAKEEGVPPQVIYQRWEIAA